MGGRGLGVWNQLLRNPSDFESLILMTYGTPKDSQRQELVEEKEPEQNINAITDKIDYYSDTCFVFIKHISF
jgi:hypothetical protein